MVKIIYFPKNVWKQIKSFEFQLLYPLEVQMQFLDNIRLILNSNYFFSIDNIFIPKSIKKIDYEYQYNYLKNNYPKYWNVFTNDFLKLFIKRHNNNFCFNY